MSDCFEKKRSGLPLNGEGAESSDEMQRELDSPAETLDQEIEDSIQQDAQWISTLPQHMIH
jgi:hypothetical protein